MNRELHNAVHKGAKLLDEKGPADWRERAATALAGGKTEPWRILEHVYGYYAAYQDALVALGLATIAPQLANANTYTDELMLTLFNHGYWLYAEADDKEWDPIELIEAWRHELSPHKVPLPD